MVVGLALAAVQMGMALPTGFLFGVGYGTGVRIGYEQVYPLLFPKGARSTTTELAATMKGMNTVYDAIGGKDASRMGIAVGITNAGEILKNPDFQVLEQLESSSSGPTSSSLDQTSRSGRGALDLSDSSSDEIVAEEIAAFNELTNSQMWTKIRAMSTGQIINSRTGQGMSQEWMDITGKVLLERTESNFTGPTTDLPASEFHRNFEETRSVETLAFKNKMNDLLTERVTRINYIKAMDAKIQTGNRQAIQWKKNAQSRLFDINKELRRMSNRYRDPNNEIRKLALLLRQQL